MWSWPFAAKTLTGTRGHLLGRQRAREHEDRICTSSGEARQGGEAEPAAEQMEQLRRRITIFTLYIYGISEIRLGGCDRRVLAVTEISFPREGAENQVFYVEKYENYPPEGPPTSAIVDPAGRSSERGQKQGPPFLCKKGAKKLQYFGLLWY